MKHRMTIQQLCMIALAIVINVVGGQIALALHLPIYLDSIGTILIGVTLGPWLGLIPGLLGGLIMTVTGDIYSLFFAPVGMILGFVTGWVFRRYQLVSGNRSSLRTVLGILGRAVLITVPATVVSASICALAFGGITSSGSTVLVQLLQLRTPLNMTESVLVVQLLTDYADRAVSLLLVAAILRVVPATMRAQLFSRG